MMKFLALLLAFAGAAGAQPAHPDSAHPDSARSGIFHVADYQASGTHTQYDMARQAADAWTVAHAGAGYGGGAGAQLYLLPDTNWTCDSAPLPNVIGKLGTTSIHGYGAEVSSIVKKSGCPPAQATLFHGPNPNLQEGRYDGFTVSANHIDAAACDIYGMKLVWFTDVACGDAAGGDHQWEFGARAPGGGNPGWVDNLHAEGISTFDHVGGGKGASLAPVWSNGTLTSVTVTNPGTKKYNATYARARLIGSGVFSCKKIPTLKPTVSTVDAHPANYFPNLPAFNYGWVTGATISEPGQCKDTAHIYVLIQDGVPNTYGFKFTNLADSVLSDVEATGAPEYGEYFSNISSANSISGEHPYTNATFQIADAGGGNTHLGAYCDSPGWFCAVLDGPKGQFLGTKIAWDGIYPGSSGYYFRGADGVKPDGWFITDSICNAGSFAEKQPWFALYTNRNGAISAANPKEDGVKFTNANVCDGSHTTY